MAHSGRFAELGTLGTNRGERKLGREDPVNRNLPKNQAGHQNDPVDQNSPENVTGHQQNRVRGSSSTGEILELSENSVGLSLPDEQQESEEDLGENFFSSGEQSASAPRIVVPSEKSIPAVKVDFLEQHRSQFSALVESSNMGNFSSKDWELFMTYKVEPHKTYICSLWRVITVHTLHRDLSPACTLAPALSGTCRFYSKCRNSTSGKRLN